MVRAILTSSMGGSIKVDGKRIPTPFMENNGFLGLLRTVWKEGAKVMIIGGSPDDHERNDSVLDTLRESCRLSGLSYSEFLMCDDRVMELADRIPDMDVLILAGGHVPTQNAFMKALKLKERLTGFKGLVLAWSAGSMNCAGTVYAGPELPGEATDPSFERWISGLGLTDINIFPHFDELREDMLDGMRLIEDITFGDSLGHDLTALNNGSYIVLDDAGTTLYGEAYSIKDGVLKQICSNGASIRL